MNPKPILQFIEDKTGKSVPLKHILNLYKRTSVTLEECEKEINRTGGDLILNFCENLITLPENLKVPGALSLLKCESLKSIPDNIEAGTYISLNKCTRLKSIGKNLRAVENIVLRECVSLTYIPDNLTCDILSVNNCENLTKVGKNIKVNALMGISNTPLNSWSDEELVEKFGLKDKGWIWRN